MVHEFLDGYKNLKYVLAMTSHKSGTEVCNRFCSCLIYLFLKRCMFDLCIHGFSHTPTLQPIIPFWMTLQKNLTFMPTRTLVSTDYN